MTRTYTLGTFADGTTAQWNLERDGHLVVVAPVSWGKSYALGLIHEQQQPGTDYRHQLFPISAEQATAKIADARPGTVVILDEVALDEHQLHELLDDARAHGVVLAISLYRRPAFSLDAFTARLGLGPLGPDDLDALWPDAHAITYPHRRGHGIYTSPTHPDTAPLHLTSPTRTDDQPAAPAPEPHLPPTGSAAVARGAVHRASARLRRLLPR